MRQATFRSFVTYALMSAFEPAEALAQTFLEQDGEVVIEVESEPATGAWQVSQSISGYKGQSYYLWTGANQTTGGNGLLTYQIQIQNPGNYQFMLRSRITVGTDDKEHNDTFVSMSGTPISGQWAIGTNVWTKAYMGHLNRWTWQTATKDFDPKPIRQFFSAGLHTIRLSGRSNGHAIDRFILFKYADKPYENNFSVAGSTQEAALTAKPQSPTTGGGGGGDPVLLCFPAGESPSLAGAMTTSTELADGDDLDTDEDSLTSPLLFADSTTNSLSGGSGDDASYTINLPSSGQWYAWGRMYSPDAPTSNGANSFLLRVDNGSRLRFGNNLSLMREWHYGGNGAVETGTPSALPLGVLSAGNHTLVVEKREVVTTPPRLDVICVTNQTAIPTDAEVCEAIGGCAPVSGPDIACVAAGDPATLTGAMTTGTAFTNGADADANLDNLTTPLLFADSTTNTGTTDAATYQIDVPSDGTWYLWSRFYYPGAAGSNDANSFQARIGSASFQAIGNKRDGFQQWHWDGSGATETGIRTGLPLGSLTAGTKTLTVRKREVVPIPPRIDVLCITRSQSTPPTDGEACTALGGC